MALPPLVTDAIDRADRQLAAGGYESVSVRTAEVRRRLDAMRWPYVHPDRPTPAMAQVEHTAWRLVAVARRKASLRSGAAGLVGAWGLPPEVAATAVATLRLGQRLGVTFGFDHETDRGRMALLRALAHGLELELPEHGAVGLRVSEVGAWAAGRLDPTNVTLWLVRGLLTRSASSVATGAARLIPVVSAGVGAAAAHARTQALGGRMIALYRQLAEVPLLALPEEAEEVR